MNEPTRSINIHAAHIAPASTFSYYIVAEALDGRTFAHKHRFNYLPDLLVAKIREAKAINPKYWEEKVAHPPHLDLVLF